MQRSSYRYLVVDVFADRPGAGNPLGVVLDAADWDSMRMQAFAAWTNLSETVYFLPPTTLDASYRIRIFTPRQELPFAGHPSVGAAWVSLETGLVSDTDRLVQECAAGRLPVRVVGTGPQRMITLRAPRARPVGIEPPPQALRAVLASLPTAGLQAALWNNGPSWWLMELEDDAAVRGLAPDLAAIAALTQATAAVGLAVFGRTPAGADHDLAVRAFCPADNIPEDPVTGSVNACIAAALDAADALPGHDGRYIASQGRELGRDGRVALQVDADGEVWIGGHVQGIIDGRATW
ncbi:PhzF family phenazine biosynthesis protein [Pseudoxanthomonas sp. LjRoot143]|uniref:PhzF family phenazine biosynthesis protein n=1 Tax=Pseudoxanthomonas sp. LjRoot143 TaxID=3342266 RepID=UPI003ED08E81